jgi:hemerythrin-like metal-binding protein
MAYVEWNEKYSVKVQSIDEQHKKLFEMINGFYIALKDTAPEAALQALLDSLLEYTVFHFKHEEGLMQRCAYPGLEAQQAAHVAFTQKVGDVLSRHKDGRLVLSVEITGFLKSWLTEHILQSDSKYVPALIAGGVH